MYSFLDSIDNARKVFDKTRNRTIYVYNALFRALSLVGHGEEVLDTYRRMNSIGIPSDRFSYTYVLKACVASDCLVSLLNKGKEIHAHILRHGYDGYVHIMTTLVDMYAKFGCVSNASCVFNQMPVKKCCFLECYDCLLCEEWEGFRGIGAVQGIDARDARFMSEFCDNG
ncbi:hypothetical protein OIU74_008667 [Salix koriyanagi]|uniref:Pentatricopeptide repeat-containing protein n=1 Tax=Salix koriyanagi TaxID=2511006 RepID=A0A9Q0TQL1_9ROSI|nr:hypothetical protein OIU74_008667 [Salix koriyanagi]